MKFGIEFGDSQLEVVGLEAPRTRRAYSIGAQTGPEPDIKARLVSRAALQSTP